MKTQDHIYFALLVVEKFDMTITTRLTDWSIVPDMNLYFGGLWNTILHRATLHGMGNITFCKQKGESLADVRYFKKYDKLIECLLVSHNYLDMLNSIILPSYPDSSEIKFLPAQFKSYFTFKTPNEVYNVMNCLVSEHECIESLTETMRSEYHNLPFRVGRFYKYFTEVF